MALTDEIEKTRRAGEQILELVKTDRSRLEPRLAAGLIDGLAADLPLLLDAAMQAADTRQAKKASTKTQVAAAERLQDQVMALRSVLRMRKAPAELCTLAGVGKPVKSGVVGSILESAALMLSAYDSRPADFRLLGVLPADIEAVRTLYGQLASADQAQEALKVTAREKTARRNAAHKRVQEAIAAIAGAAELAFLGRPDRLELYRSLVPRRPAPSRKPANPSA